MLGTILPPDVTTIIKERCLFCYDCESPEVLAQLKLAAYKDADPRTEIDIA